MDDQGQKEIQKGEGPLKDQLCSHHFPKAVIRGDWSSDIQDHNTGLGIPLNFTPRFSCQSFHRVKQCVLANTRFVEKMSMKWYGR